MRDIESIIEKVKERFPKVSIAQLKVMHPADDDGLWFFSFENPKDEIQIESSFGKCPFLIESNRNDERRYGHSVDEVVDIVCEHLKESEHKDE